MIAQSGENNFNFLMTSEDMFSRITNTTKERLRPSCMIPQEIPLSIGSKIIQMSCELIDDIKVNHDMINKGAMRAHELVKHVNELKKYAVDIQNLFDCIRKAIRPYKLGV